ncbi:MAG: BolA family transcriptional regulator [Rhodospirillaceae bacterium]|nr:BolA family transcriptional regulator [Rhodospirillaceae bacterium]MBT3925558.1 BolA family transcriptional regulator [Rhodospirillaceae bacterium]MBT4428780.1 BolA family transcriptional regulator [Rhodospirillaceae bacterium]MBT5674331.1 BolA family transcriptional regulator [Rhodospirillaceae bacterium]MBT5779019.1 BolA family transcriptional regulator [Rhodospirillaceae bacterium]
MAMDSAEVVQLIQESIPDADVRIDDLRGDGDHYSATVLSASFKGITRVQQHQLVYKALKGRMGEQLHALALKTGVPVET